MRTPTMIRAGAVAAAGTIPAIGASNSKQEKNASSEACESSSATLFNASCAFNVSCYCRCTKAPSTCCDSICEPYSTGVCHQAYSHYQQFQSEFQLYQTYQQE